MFASCPMTRSFSLGYSGTECKDLREVYPNKKMKEEK